MDANNGTFSPPPGTTTHGTSSLLCVPPSWTDYISFFTSNYLAHVGTLIQTPGQTGSETIARGLIALFLPGSGALRAVRWLIIRPATYQQPIERAAASGALCTVLKSSKIWRRGKPPQQVTTPSSGAPGNKEKTSNNPAPPEPASDWSACFEGTPRVISTRRNVNGTVRLPMGYQLIELPPGTCLKDYEGGSNSGSDESSQTALMTPMVDEQLTSSFDRTSVLVGLVQLLFGLVTLYRARGDQIDLYGYAAFGLTVAPYAIVSVMNSAAALVTPQYPVLHLVHSPDMDEAARDGGDFTRVLASIDIDAMSRLGHPIPFDPMLAGRTRIYGLAASAICALSPLALVGGLSGFKAGQMSSTSQRGWILSWLLAGIIFPLCSRYLQLYRAGNPEISSLRSLLFYAITFTPALGGIVTSFLMLRDYGICTRFSS